jgi:hypothetical protein
MDEIQRESSLLYLWIRIRFVQNFELPGFPAELLDCCAAPLQDEQSAIFAHLVELPFCMSACWINISYNF